MPEPFSMATSSAPASSPSSSSSSARRLENAGAAAPPPQLMGGGFQLEPGAPKAERKELEVLEVGRKEGAEAGAEAEEAEEEALRGAGGGREDHWKPRPEMLGLEEAVLLEEELAEEEPN